MYLGSFGMNNDLHKPVFPLAVKALLVSETASSLTGSFCGAHNRVPILNWQSFSIVVSAAAALPGARIKVAYFGAEQIKDAARLGVFSLGTRLKCLVTAWVTTLSIWLMLMRRIWRIPSG